ncbi:MAG: response regulator [Candidatus Krumholzibacteriia bacterium]
MATLIIWVGGALLVGLAGGILLDRWWTRRRLGDDDPAAEVINLRRHLSRAQRMEALGILSGSIMHNLNNLLSVVLGQARLARDDVARDSSVWRNLTQVIQAGEAAAELSREVDSYNRDDDHDRRPLRLQPVVRATVKLLRDILPDTVDIETDLDAACGPVLASSTQVQQVLMSLSSNAYHAMFRRRGRIVIGMHPATIDSIQPAIPRDLVPGHYVKLSVADNGRGMDGETLGRIFEPYYSARAPRRGAGLGLTMVSRLLAANEGVTVATSLPGHGTRFDIYFPLIARGVLGGPERGAESPALRLVEPGDHYRPPAVKPRVAHDPPAAGRPAHVLLVEDDDMVAATVRICLERAGMTVTSFADGAQAVTAFARDPGAFDLLLTDQFMGGLDGREVVREVHGLRPHLPVIIMSGHPEGLRSGDVQSLNLAGTLTKPFTPSRLLETVKKALVGHPRALEGEA